MFVFGYGSLAAEAPRPVTASIRGFVRTWDVAMDNLVDLPGYKYYLDPVSGERPAVHVTFLNLAPAPGVDAVGFLLPANPQILARLDARERNYDRVEVTELILSDRPLMTRVYTYIGSPEARERYTGAQTPVIARAYLEQVEASFAPVRAGYEATTRPPACAVRELTRINLPGAPAPGPAAPSAPRTGPPDTRSPHR